MLSLIEKTFQKSLRSRQYEGMEIRITCFYEELPMVGDRQVRTIRN